MMKLEEGINLEKYSKILESVDPVKLNGRVTQVVGLVIESDGPAVAIGELCYVYSKKMSVPVKAEV
ncbi:MAG: flagellum-specific ATP synthase FliI, partial [Candidatus Omnitrophica bacterium]|nr:flagellum-specific ATP synthase FliI [Candidatus Omnitrophota bacterium]